MSSLPTAEWHEVFYTTDENGHIKGMSSAARKRAFFKVLIRNCPGKTCEIIGIFTNRDKLIDAYNAWSDDLGLGSEESHVTIWMVEPNYIISGSTAGISPCNNY